MGDEQGGEEFEELLVKWAKDARCVRLFFLSVVIGIEHGLFFRLALKGEDIDMDGMGSSDEYQLAPMS